ncbi:MAG: LysM peptidoglycan-binding domain-containing protein [Rhodobacterales bacterium]|nr:LysM peptidoglycan-binding domain-containing protein [Rhodobacterales bacterium]
MKRLILGIFAVAAVLCAWIVMPPMSSWSFLQPGAAPGGETGVTRNVTSPLSEDLAAEGGTAAVLETDATTLREVTAGIVQALEAPDAELPLTPLQSLVLVGLQEGLPDLEIDRLVNEAAAKGDVTVPAVLVTDDLSVDTFTLLASVEVGVRNGTFPAPSSQTVAHPVVVGVTRTYVVRPGDSLGSISEQFFGSSIYDDAIFSANRNVLANPDDLSVGQTLIIPEL